MPILNLQQRIREVGRIRLGVKGAKGQPVKLETFRFTSFDKSAIAAAAGLYGGNVEACSDPELEGQWEVITDANEIPIMVSPIAPSQHMELWRASGCERRCDGVTESLSGKPCMCDPDEPKCKPTTRLSLILPDLPGLGIWLFVSHGWNVATEIIQTYEFLQQLAGQKEFAEAKLGVEIRKSKENGQSREFPVAVIRADLTPRQLLAAQLARPALPAQPVSQAPALPAGEKWDPMAAQAAEQPVKREKEAEPEPELDGDALRRRYFAIHGAFNFPPHEGETKTLNYGVWGRLLGRAVESAASLKPGEWEKLVTWIHRFELARDGKWPEGAAEPKVPGPYVAYQATKSRAPAVDPFSDEIDPFAED